MIISSKFTLFVALFALAFTFIAALPIEEADSFEDSFLNLEEAMPIQSTPMNIHLVVDNEFELFVNGKQFCSGNHWHTTYDCQTTVIPGDVIALNGRDTGGPAAFIGVFNGVVTQPSDWRCKDTTSPGTGWNTNNFDDSSWPQAVSHGRNDGNNPWRGVSRPKIPADAQWLWTADNNNHDRVYCRYVPIKQNAAATDVKGDVSGLNVQYYNLGGEKSKLPDFSTLKPSRTDVSAQIDFPSTGGNFATSEATDFVAAVWTGFINVPSSGSWELFLNSDDGSKLFIGDKLIVDNDGLHGMREHSGNIALGAGKHPLRVEFFENGGGAGIIMQWKGPGVSKAVVPASALTRKEMPVTAATDVKFDVSGLNVQYYNLGGEKSKLPDFSTLKPSRTDVSAQINFPSTNGNFATSEAKDYVAAVWTGFINVPSSGSWDLFLDSDDGSKLFIGDKLIVDNDGLHGMKELSNNIALGAGKHPLRVEFFENGGGAGIIMQWKGPGVSKAVVPASALTRIDEAAVRSLNNSFFYFK
jgi:hypothetical protein